MKDLIITFQFENKDIFIKYVIIDPSDKSKKFGNYYIYNRENKDVKELFTNWLHDFTEKSTEKYCITYLF